MCTCEYTSTCVQRLEVGVSVSLPPSPPYVLRQDLKANLSVLICLTADHKPLKILFHTTFQCTCSCCCFFFFFTGVLWRALSLSGSYVTFTDGPILMPRLCSCLSSLSLIILELSDLLTTPWQPSGVSDIWLKTSRLWKHGPSFCSHGFTMGVFCAPLRQLPCCLLTDSRWQAAHH